MENVEDVEDDEGMWRMIEGSTGTRLYLRNLLCILIDLELESFKNRRVTPDTNLRGRASNGACTEPHGQPPVSSQSLGQEPRAHGVFHVDLRQQFLGQPGRAGEVLNAASSSEQQPRQEANRFRN